MNNKIKNILTILKNNTKEEFIFLIEELQNLYEDQRITILENEDHIEALNEDINNRIEDINNLENDFNNLKEKYNNLLEGITDLTLTYEEEE